MKQNEYIQAIDEMIIPASKILFWATIVEQQYQEYYEQYNKINRAFFDQVIVAAQDLVNLIPKAQDIEQTDKTEIFTHMLSGPIMTIRDSTKLILLQHKGQGEGQSERKNEYIRYLQKIKSAAEYLSSLDRDAVLKIHIKNLNDERGLSTNI